MTSLAPAFVRRDEPLDPVAVFASGSAALRLGRRLLDRLPLERPPRALASVGAERWLLLIGVADSLPWVDGAQWLGRDPEAPGLLVPTRRGSDLHPVLLERAVKARFPDLEAPLVVLPGRRRVLPGGRARTVGEAELQEWLG